MKRFDRNDPKSSLLFHLFYFAAFCGSSIQGSFIGLYLTEAGVPVKTLGILNGVNQTISLITLPIFGRIADNAKKKNTFLDAGYILTIAILVAFMFVKNVAAIVALRFIYSIIATPIMSVYETMTMENCGKHGWEYGPIRMSGTIGFSIASLLSGFGLKENLKAMFPMIIACNAVTLLFALLLPDSYRVERKVSAEGVEEKGESVYSILRVRAVRNVLFMFFIYSLAASINLTYFSNYAVSLGGSYSMVGIAYSILGFSEIPFHVGPGKRWLQKLGVERSLLMVLAVGLLRWTVCAMTNNATVLMWTMILNGIQLVPVIIGMAQFLYDHAPEGLKVTAQTSLRSTVSVAAMLVADFGGSAMYHIFEMKGINGYKGMYYLMVPMCIIGMICGIVSIRKGQAAGETIS